jgi:hypothetical protein
MKMKITVFWYVEPCSPVDNDRRFRGTYYGNLKGDGHGSPSSTLRKNVGSLRHRQSACHGLTATIAHTVLFRTLTQHRPLIILIMEAISFSETPVSIYQTTRRNIPEDIHLHTRCRGNLKSHLECIGLLVSGILSLHEHIWAPLFQEGRCLMTYFNIYDRPQLIYV